MRNIYRLIMPTCYGRDVIKKKLTILQKHFIDLESGEAETGALSCCLTVHFKCKLRM